MLLELIAGLLLGLVVPFTLIVILPTNKGLLDPASTAAPLRLRPCWRGGGVSTRFGAS